MSISAFLKSRISFRPLVESDPLTWPKWKKTTVLIVIAASAMLPGFSSTIYLPSVPNIRKDLNTTEILVTLTLSLFILFMGLAPVIWAALSDTFKFRRWIYLISLTIFTVASALSIFVNDISLLIVLRCLQSIGSSAAASVGGGSISDMFAREERGRSMGLLMGGATIGPLLGPIIGGFVTDALSWRATFAIAAGLGALMILLQFFLAPETYRDIHKWGPVETAFGDSEKINSEQSVKVEDTEDEQLSAITTVKRRSLFDGIRLLAFRFVLIPALCGSISFAIMFTFETLMSTMYENVYGITASQVGLTFLGGGGLSFISSMISGRVSDYSARKTYQRRVLKNSENSLLLQESTPEDRINFYSLFIGFALIPFGSLLFGWSLYAKLSIALPIIGFALTCFGMVDLGITSSTYLVDSLSPSGQASAAASSVTLFRMVFAAILSVIATPWNQSLGIHWLGTVLAFLSFIASFGL
ncbi:hypothetical protein HK096_007413, partial [Nowakowskiella sp. JEL0078]